MGRDGEGEMSQAGERTAWPATSAGGLGRTSDSHSPAWMLMAMAQAHRQPIPGGEF